MLLHSRSQSNHWLWQYVKTWQHHPDIRQHGRSPPHSTALALEKNPYMRRERNGEAASDHRTRWKRSQWPTQYNSLLLPECHPLVLSPCWEQGQQHRVSTGCQQLAELLQNLCWGEGPSLSDNKLPILQTICKLTSFPGAPWLPTEPGAAIASSLHAPQNGQIPAGTAKCMGRETAQQDIRENHWSIRFLPVIINNSLKDFLDHKLQVL